MKRVPWSLMTAIYFLILGGFFLVLGLAALVPLLIGGKSYQIAGVPYGSALWGAVAIGFALFALLGLVFIRYTVRRWCKWESRTPVLPS